MSEEEKHNSEDQASNEQAGTETETDTISKKVTKEFQEMVVNWVTIDDEVRELQAKMKELKEEKKQYEGFILEFLESVDEKMIQISDGNLRRNVSKTKGPLKPELIQTALTDLTKNKDTAMQMTKYIMEKRPVTERINLKRTSFRKKKGGKKDGKPI